MTEDAARLRASAEWLTKLCRQERSSRSLSDELEIEVTALCYELADGELASVVMNQAWPLFGLRVGALELALKIEALARSMVEEAELCEKRG